MGKSNFDLSKFIGAVRFDSLARVNRFEVFINPPEGMINKNRSNAGAVSLYCEMSSLPPVNISTKSFKIFGPTYQRPFGAEFGGEGISMTFHVDRDMQVKKFFDDWTSTIVDPSSGFVNYQDQYTSTIILRQLDEQDNVTYEIELEEAFPRSLNLLELNNSAQNQTHRLNVLFAYRYWRQTQVGINDKFLQPSPTVKLNQPPGSQELFGNDFSFDSSNASFDNQNQTFDQG